MYIRKSFLNIFTFWAILFFAFSFFIGIGSIVVLAEVDENNASELLTATCSVSATHVNIGQEITWSANVSGGLAPYSINWSSRGDFISGSGDSISVSFSDSKVIMAEFSAADSLGNVMTNISCDNVTIIAPLEFQSCQPEEVNSNTGYRVDWTANITGGIKPYVLSWTGTDELSGDSTTTSIVYNTTGTKTASISNISSSDGQVLIGPFDCSGSVEVHQAPANSGGGGSSSGNVWIDDQDPETCEEGFVATHDGEVLICSTEESNIDSGVVRTSSSSGSGFTTINEEDEEEESTLLSDENLNSLIALLSFLNSIENNQNQQVPIAVPEVVQNQTILGEATDTTPFDTEDPQEIDEMSEIENNFQEEESLNVAGLGFLLAAVENLQIPIFEFIANNWLWILLILITFSIFWLIFKRKRKKEDSVK